VLENDTDPPRWMRGPIEAGSTSAVAGGGNGALAVAWAVAAPDARSLGAARLAMFARGIDEPSIQRIARESSPVVTDLACGEACVLSYGGEDHEGDPDIAEHASWGRFEPWRPSAPFETIAELRGRLPLNAIADATAAPIWIGTATHEHVDALVSRDGTAHRIDTHVLDAAAHAGIVRAVIARAPNDNECQPGAWALDMCELRTTAPTGDVTCANMVHLATIDSRPRGVRLRSVGTSGDPLVTWVEAPQCNPNVRGLRAWRRGHVVSLAIAQEYDIAADGDRLSFVLRQAGSLRWIRARCR
jgi:hypothetical protein